jgi:hypothetical protein
MDFRGTKAKVKRMRLLSLLIFFSNPMIRQPFFHFRSHPILIYMLYLSSMGARIYHPHFMSILGGGGEMMAVMLVKLSKVVEVMVIVVR